MERNNLYLQVKLVNRFSEQISKNMKAQSVRESFMQSTDQVNELWSMGVADGHYTLAHLLPDTDQAIEG